MYSKPELLCPAGDRECLETALRFGADAVYIGGDFMQLRAAKAGFTRDGLADAVSFAHKSEKKLYVTVNCFAKNSEIEPLKDYAKFLCDINVDAAIISDIGALATMKNAAPGLTAHISTQANCTNHASAEVYYNMGASRVVLARELSLTEIAELRAKVPKELELEAFVHGAMCMSYSGRCLISSYMNNRSGNRGECTQPCRWNYYLVEQKRPGEFFEVIEDGGASAILSSHDLCCIDFLDDIAAAGVCSFKIEGRMKTPYYVATVANAYRRAIDKTAGAETLRRELTAISHRPYSSGFYFGEVANNPNNDGLYHTDAKFIGVVREVSDGFITVEQRNAFSVGDELEILSPLSIGESITVNEIISAGGERKDSAVLVQECVKIPCDKQICTGDILRRRDKND